jgi:hypothetical protein
MTIVNVHIYNFGAMCFEIIFKDLFEVYLYIIPILIYSFTWKCVYYNWVKPWGFIDCKVRFERKEIHDIGKPLFKFFDSERTSVENIDLILFLLEVVAKYLCCGSRPDN